MDGGLVAHGELVIPGGYGPVALEPADAAFDSVTLLVRSGPGRRPPARPRFLRWRIWSALSGIVYRIPRVVRDGAERARLTGNAENL